MKGRIKRDLKKLSQQYLEEKFFVEQQKTILYLYQKYKNGEAIEPMLSFELLELFKEWDENVRNNRAKIINIEYDDEEDLDRQLIKMYREFKEKENC